MVSHQARKSALLTDWLPHNICEYISTSYCKYIGRHYRKGSAMLAHCLPVARNREDGRDERMKRETQLCR